MTKAAILRRQCRRAMNQLVKRFGYPESSFDIPTAKENGYDVLPGTPIYWTPPSYYEGESDYRPARDEYDFNLMVETVNWDAMARQDYMRHKYPSVLRGPR